MNNTIHQNRVECYSFPKSLTMYSFSDRSFSSIQNETLFIRTVHWRGDCCSYSWLCLTHRWWIQHSIHISIAVYSIPIRTQQNPIPFEYTNVRVWMILVPHGCCKVYKGFWLVIFYKYKNWRKTETRSDSIYHFACFIVPQRIRFSVLCERRIWYTHKIDAISLRTFSNL